MSLCLLHGSRKWESMPSISVTETLTTRWGSPLVLPSIILPTGSLFQYLSIRSCMAHVFRQGFRSLLSPKGGDSSTTFESKIIDRFFEIAIAAASVGRFYTFVHPVKSLLSSFTLATRVCLLHGNSVFVIDKYWILTNAPWIQPPACAGRFRIEDFVSVCVERSGTLLVSLCPEPRRTRTALPYRQPNIDCLGTLRRGERPQRSPGKRGGNIVCRPRNPNVAVAADPGLRLLGLRILNMLEELIGYGPEFHAPSVASHGRSSAQPKARASLCKPCSLRELAFMPYSMSQRSSQSKGTSRSFRAVCSTSRMTLRPTLLTGSILVFPSKLSRLLGRTVRFRKSTVPVPLWKHADCVPWSTLGPIIPPQLQVITRGCVGACPKLTVCRRE